MKTKFTLLGATVVALLSSSAYAGSWDHHDNGWHGHEHERHERHEYHDREDYHDRDDYRGGRDRSRVSFSLNFGAPAYYRYHPYPPAPYYNSTQYIYTQPVSESAMDDRYCREYQTTARVAGRLQPSYGTACYQPDGSWQIVAD